MKRRIALKSVKDFCRNLGRAREVSSIRAGWAWHRRVQRALNRVSEDDLRRVGFNV